MFNIGLIDSLKLRIKKDDIVVVDPTFIMPFMKFYPDNNSFELSLNDSEPLTKIINGITYRYYFKCYPNPKTGVLEEFLVLQISAKMLKERYFEGLNKTNYHEIVKDINNQFIIKITEKAFLNGLVSDIDICINQLIDIKSYQTALSLLYNFSKSSVKPLLHLFESKNKNHQFINLGLDFNKREKAKNTTPYLKIYHKGLELERKSKTFFSYYLSGVESYNRSSFLNNLVRYEFTIKAYKHKEYLKEKKLLTTEIKTLKDLFNVSSNELTNIAKSGINHYIEKTVKPKKIKDLSPIDNLLLHYMQQLIFKGEDRDSLKYYLHTIECPVTKSRIKTKINTLLKHLENENQTITNKLNENEKVLKFLGKLGF